MSALPLSVQLYTLRDEAGAGGLAGVLKRLADIGYAAVEPAGGGFHDLAPAEFRRVLDDLGLAVSSSHVRLPVGPEKHQILDAQEAIGNTTIITSVMADGFASADAVARTAERFNEAVANAHARGMRLGYHNHWWEFETPVGDGTAYDAFLAAVDPSVFLEVDVYWAEVGGQDAAALIRRLGERVRFLHVKDGPLVQGEPMTAVGQGKVDIPGVLDAGTHVEWRIVELDACATDMFEAVAESHRYLTSLGR